MMGMSGLRVGLGFGVDACARGLGIELSLKLFSLAFAPAILF